MKSHSRQLEGKEGRVIWDNEAAVGWHCGIKSFFSLSSSSHSSIPFYRLERAAPIFFFPCLPIFSRGEGLYFPEIYLQSNRRSIWIIAGKPNIPFYTPWGNLEEHIVFDESHRSYVYQLEEEVRFFIFFFFLYGSRRRSTLRVLKDDWLLLQFAYYVVVVLGAERWRSNRFRILSLCRSPYQIAVTEIDDPRRAFSAEMEETIYIDQLYESRQKSSVEYPQSYTRRLTESMAVLLLWCVPSDKKLLNRYGVFKLKATRKQRKREGASWE